HLLGGDVFPGPRRFGGRLAQDGVLGRAELFPPLLLGLGDFGGSTGYWIHNSTLIGSARWGDVAGERVPRTGISRRTRRAWRARRSTPCRSPRTGSGRPRRPPPSSGARWSG